MHKTLSNGRPQVKFDVESVEHRHWYSVFRKKRSWKDCPVQFVIDDQLTSNLIYNIEQLLLTYYCQLDMSAHTQKVIRFDPVFN